MDLQSLADTLVFGTLLDELRASCGSYDIVDHWQQGEFHHDIVLRVPNGLPGSILIVATNCNGGVKEVLSFGELPERFALWKHRCPENSEFEGELPPILGRAITVHWFDPCEILKPDARSELREEFRERQRGGGWVSSGCGAKKPS